jgi:CheY-like chemotaxis protein
MTMPNSVPHHILLAEDDDDDSMLFKEVLNELSVNANFIRVKDGEELMHLLHRPENKLPDILFLDINMPRKNGFECLLEIKKTDKLKNLPVIVLSTSSGKELVSKMYDAGASLYVCKPNQFAHFKNIIQTIMSTKWSLYFPQPPFEKFMVQM